MKLLEHLLSSEATEDRDNGSQRFCGYPLTHCHTAFVPVRTDWYPATDPDGQAPGGETAPGTVSSAAWSTGTLAAGVTVGGAARRGTRDHHPPRLALLHPD